MNYDEIDSRTREYMLSEFEREQSSKTPYRSKALSVRGLGAFAMLMASAIKSGTELTLAQALGQTDFWEAEEQYTRAGITRNRQRNVLQSTTRLSLTEFSTWYVRGLAKRLIDDGIEKCQVYRGEQPKWEPGECAEHEGCIVSVQSIYDNHRARYWPEPGDSTAFSIPFGPSCHHVIRRLI